MDTVEYNDIPDYSGHCPNCPKCGTVLGYSYVISEFKCPKCGFTIDERDWEWDEDELPDMPYCCVACGGDYPNCMSSCKIFDD